MRSVAHYHLNLFKRRPFIYPNFSLTCNSTAHLNNSGIKDMKHGTGSDHRKSSGVSKKNNENAKN